MNTILSWLVVVLLVPLVVLETYEWLTHKEVKMRTYVILGALVVILLVVLCGLAVPVDSANRPTPTPDSDHYYWLPLTLATTSTPRPTVTPGMIASPTNRPTPTVVLPTYTPEAP